MPASKYDYVASPNHVARAACGMPAPDTKARQDKLMLDMDMQVRVLRELLDELRELNGSAV